MKVDYLFLGLYCTFIFVLSHQSTLPVPLAFPHQDKLIHASAYAVMGLLAWRAFRFMFSSKQVLAFAAILFCSAYGVSDEFHQSLIAGRDADVWDWFADTVGASLMVFILYKYLRLKT